MGGRRGSIRTPKAKSRGVSPKVVQFGIRKSAFVIQKVLKVGIPGVRDRRECWEPPFIEGVVVLYDLLRDSGWRGFGGR